VNNTVRPVQLVEETNMTSITRRDALTLAIAASAGATWPARARAEDSIELKVSHYLPPNHTFQKELVRWGDDLDRGSGGRLKLRIYPASQLGPVNRQFDLVRNGIADIAVGLHGATPGRYPMTELASLAFQSPDAGNNSAVTSKRLTELAPEYLANEHQGMRILWMAATNPLKFHVARKAIAVVMNPRRFDGLAKDLQDMILANSGPGEGERVGKMFDTAESAGREYMLSKKVQILTLPPSEVQKLRDVLAPNTNVALEANEKAGRPGRAFLKAYTA